MAKLCPKGKAAAKRKFKVYPSAYANMYASGVCSGKIKPGGRTKKAEGGKIKKVFPTNPSIEQEARDYYTRNFGSKKAKAELGEKTRDKRKVKKMGGGIITQPRAMYGKGGGVCIRGMNRDAIGKNS
jgi:hypothetical protein